MANGPSGLGTGRHPAEKHMCGYREIRHCLSGAATCEPCSDELIQLEGETAEIRHCENRETTCKVAECRCTRHEGRHEWGYSRLAVDEIIGLLHISFYLRLSENFTWIEEFAK